MSNIQSDIQQALQEIRPFLARHAGDAEFVRFENGIVYLRMLGSCSGCPLSQITLKMGIERMIKERLPNVLGVEIHNENNSTVASLS